MYDLIILGGGPAGYVAAERAGHLGKKTLLVEKNLLGGVCLNCGCIPTKAFLHAAKLYDHALHGDAFGVAVEGARFDYSVMKARTEKVQETLRNGVAMMLKKNKVDVAKGAGVVTDRNTVVVDDTTYRGANLLLCSGSRPALPPIPGLDGNPAVVDSTGLLALPRPAESLVVIGGGVIGVEFACFHALIGKKVTVIEALPQILSVLDRDIAVSIQRKLEAKGVSFHTAARVERVENGTVSFTDKQGAAQSVTADAVLVAAGRAPNLAGNGYETLGLDMDDNRILVNERAETNIPGVYAAGDITGSYQLAHFASRQATVAVNTMFGRPDLCRTEAVPSVVYTDPEAASVGMGEDAAKRLGLEVKTLKMPLGFSGRFLAETEGERGLVKAVVGARGELLGMHVLGPYASEMIGAACVMIENEMLAKDIGELVFPHPTVGEIMKEVCMTVV